MVLLLRCFDTSNLFTHHITAMTSNQNPRVQDVIEPIELPAVHSSPPFAPSGQSDEQNDEVNTATQSASEHVQPRGTFRTFTVMTALFVSNQSSDRQNSIHPKLLPTSSVTFSSIRGSHEGV